MRSSLKRNSANNSIPGHRLGLIIEEASLAMQGLVIQVMRQHSHPLSFKEFLALLFVFDAQRGITSSEIAKKFSNDKALISRMVKRLISLGYITTGDNPTDKRSREIFLSNKGKKLIFQVSEVVQPFETKMIDTVSKKDFQVFLQVLLKLSKYINENAGKTI